LEATNTLAQLAVPQLVQRTLDTITNGMIAQRVRSAPPALVAPRHWIGALQNHEIVADST
jgi:hypothetical protein